MKTSLRNRIYDYLRQWHSYDPNKFINGGEFERLAQEAGYKASNASRRLRELENDELIEKRLNHKGTVEYRYKPQNDAVRIIWQETNKYQTV